MNYRTTAPRIRWGTNFVNALDLAYPLDNVKAGDTPRDGSAQIQGPSGIEDAWTIGTDYVLEGDVRWIPQADVLTPRATGWDGAAGVRAFLNWARDKNQLMFCPDARNLLLYPFLNTDANGDGVVDGWTKTDPAAGAATFSLDTTRSNVQRIAIGAGGNTGGVVTYAFISQAVPGMIAGEVLQLSCDVLASGFANGVYWNLEVWAVDGNGTLFQQIGALYSYNTPTGSTAASGLAGFLRFATGEFTTPAGTASVAVRLVLGIPANTGTLSAGTVWFTCASLRRNSADLTCFDNPQIASYVVAPMKDPPPSESDGTRKLTLRLRNGSVAYDGY